MKNESPVTTIIRLLRRYLRVINEDGSLANIYVSEEWCDRELLKDFFGQVTVGLERAEEQKLSFDGKTRLKNFILKLNVWVADKPEQGMTRKMREKIVSEINRVVREYGKRPNIVDYNFVGVGCPSNSHRAYQAVSESELSPANSKWVEFTNSEYERIWYSDDNRLKISASSSNNYSLVLFCFKLDAEPDVIEELKFRFEGFGLSPLGNGAEIKVWNFSEQAWQNAQQGNASEDEFITLQVASNVTDFVDSEGYVYLLAKTLNPSDGVSEASLNVDFVDVSFKVNGISYCDIVSFRDMDEVRLKPFVWRTEFTVKALLFEKVNFSEG